MKNQQTSKANSIAKLNSQDNSKNRFISGFFICILFMTSMLGEAQNKTNDIVGNYLVPSKDGAIQIYESAGKYYGKIILNKDSTKLDVNNPDKNKQKSRLLGANILKDFKFDGSDTWENGTIYDPKNGKTYSSKITRSENGDLNIRGFIGVSLLGRSEVFVKLKK